MAVLRRITAVFNSKLADAIFIPPSRLFPPLTEIDFTVTDLVADVRATPSMAELAVPVKAKIVLMLAKQKERLFNLLNARLNKERMRLTYLTGRGLSKTDRWLDKYREEVNKRRAVA